MVGQIYPPLGILYLASYVRRRIPAIEMRARDGYNEHIETVIHDVLDFKPDILAVSFTTQAATGAYEVINRIKAAQPDVLAVSGGAHPTILAEEVLTEYRTDLVVVGEGEETFFEIVHNRLNKAPLDGIQGIVFKTGNRVRHNPLRPLIQNLDDIPFPDRSLLDLGQYPGYHYKKRAKDTSIVSARGCPYNCVYCSNPVWKVQKPRYRVRSPKNIVDEIVHIKETYGITEFYDETDEFNGKLSWAKQVCDEIIERDVDIAWKVQMRADKVDEELARKMKASGCWLAFFGIETGNDRTSRG